MADRYRYIGEQHKTFMSVQRLDGSTLAVDPNETFMLARDPKHPEIVKVERTLPAPKGTTAATKRAQIAPRDADPDTPEPPADQ